jgi:hypothetical protein
MEGQARLVVCMLLYVVTMYSHITATPSFERIDARIFPRFFDTDGTLMVDQSIRPS